MNNQPIGIFDSGIGGLTVLEKIIEKLPNEKYIYYADKINSPYGIKPKEDVKKYVEEIVEFFISKDVKAIVIACNTATSIAIKDLRKKYSIPIIGIEPAVKPAIENRENKKVLIMATPTTIKEEKLNNLLEKLNAKEYTDLIEMPRLVEFAEKNEFETIQVREHIQEKLKEYNVSDYSQLVLGCTHFPFFKNILFSIFPKEIKIIDGSLGVANRLKNLLEEKDLLGYNELEIEYYNSGKLVQKHKKIKDIKNILSEMLTN